MAVIGDHSDLRQVVVGGGLPSPASVDIEAQFHNLPRTPASVFVGRDEALTALGRALSGAAQAVVTQAVYGLGGVGKSELALHHAHTCRDRYQVVWWITADSPSQIEASLADLAARVCPAVALAETTQGAAWWAVGWLQTHPGWLLVLDNVEDPEHVQPLLGQLSNGDIIMTSRRDVGWQRVATPIKLETLLPAAATDLIIQRTGCTDPSDMKAAAEIAAELGFLPLALDQAAAYIVQNRIPLPRYRALLRDNPERMYATPAEGSQALRTIDRLWQITLETIESPQSAGHTPAPNPRQLRP